MPRHQFDVFTTTVSQLKQAFESERLTSVDVASAYLDHIAKHNVAGLGVRAVIDVAPRLLVLACAEQLDIERTTKGARGPLHGVPILIKVRVSMILSITCSL
jgi:amidase